MDKKSEKSGKARAADMAQRVLFIVAALAATAPASAQEGLSWRSYAEVGGGIKLSGGQLRPLLAMESGIFLGAVELGSYVQMIPLEFGSPDLLQAAALCYGGSLGCTLDTEALAAKPFGRIGLGGTYTAQADEKGSLAASAAAKSFSCFLSLGIELPLGDRWSARIWSAYSLLDKARDLEGRSLSGFSLGASVRAQWSTTLR